MARERTERSTEKRLDRTQVVTTALRLLNDVGLDGLSLRAIAKELDVQAPALYWHFKNKQELLDEMATEIHRRMTADPLQADPPGGWQQQLTAFCRTLRAELLRHRDGAKVYGGARFTGTEYAGSLERHLRVMTDAGFTLSQAVRTGSTAYTYTMGFVSEEQGVRPMPGERREGYDIEERSARLAAHPLAAAAGPEIFDDYDRQFEEGLRLIVAGAEAAYAGPA